GFSKSNLQLGAKLLASILFEKPTPRLTVKKLTVDNVFTSLSNSYAVHSMGELALLNDSGVDVRNIKVTLFIPEYMDNPTPCGDSKLLPNGKTGTFQLRANLNTKAYSLTENKTVNAEVKIEYMHGTRTLSMESLVSLKLLNRNALSWKN